MRRVLFLDNPAMGPVKKWEDSRDSASFLVAAIPHLAKWPKGATFEGHGESGSHVPVSIPFSGLPPPQSGHWASVDSGELGRWGRPWEFSMAGLRIHTEDPLPLFALFPEHSKMSPDSGPLLLLFPPPATTLF